MGTQADENVHIHAWLLLKAGEHRTFTFPILTVVSPLGLCYIGRIYVLEDNLS